MTATVNPDCARSFLERFGWPHTFQTFDDAGQGRRHLVCIIHCNNFNSAWRQLRPLNDAGAGIFITVNATDGRGRKASNITRVRALFVDADGTPAPRAFHKTPDVFVFRDAPEAEVLKAGNPLCRWHAYWLTDSVPLDKFSDCQKRLAAHYDTDPAINDLPRVMRVPGFIHRKAEPQKVFFEEFNLCKT